MAKGSPDNFGDNEILFDNLVNVDFRVTGDNALENAKRSIESLKNNIKELNSQIDIYKSKISSTKLKLSGTINKSWQTRYSNQIAEYKNNINEAQQGILNRERILPSAYSRFANAHKGSVWDPNVGFYDRINKFGVNKVALSASWGEVGGELHNAVSDFTDGISQMVSNVQRGFWSAGRKIRTLAASFYAIKNAVEILDNSMSSIDYMRAQAYRLKRYDKTGKSEDQLMNMAYRSAMISRSSFEDMSSLGQKILATNVTNGDASEAFRLASLISKAAVLGGSTKGEISSGIRQLTQGLAANQLGGDELRSLRENTIGLTEMLAKGIAKAYKEGILTDPEFANVQIGDLKKLGSEAKLTTKVVTTAFRMMEVEINEAFENSPKLFGHNINILSNMWQKLMYDMSKEGKGIQRIANEIQRVVDSVSSKEGQKALKEFADTVDAFLAGIIKVVKMFTGLATTIGGAIKSIGIDPKTIAGALPMLWGAGMLKNLFFGSRVMGNNGKFKNVGGMIGNGGVINSVAGYIEAINSGKGVGTMIQTALNRTPLFRMLKTIEVATTKIAGAQSINNPLLGRLVSIIGPIGIAIAAIAAIVGAYKYSDNKEEQKFYDSAKKRLTTGIEWEYLTDEDKAEVDKYIDELIKKNTDKKGWGAKWIKGVDDERLKAEVARKESELNTKRYEEQSLTYEAMIAENTKGTLDITSDFLKNIADMRTRTYRAELLAGSTRYGNNIVLNVDYKGDVADFEDKVVGAMYRFMSDAKTVTMPR